MTDEAWKPETFKLAYPSGPYPVAGYTYRGLGLHGSSHRDGKRGSWTLTHLGTGHQIAQLSGGIQSAFPVATEIAEVGDWEFISLQGWRDRFPDAGERVAEIAARHSNCTIRGSKQGDIHPRSLEVAQQIAADMP